jgi:hypothetical protein
MITLAPYSAGDVVSGECGADAGVDPAAVGADGAEAGVGGQLDQCGGLDRPAVVGGEAQLDAHHVLRAGVVVVAPRPWHTAFERSIRPS